MRLVVTEIVSSHSHVLAAFLTTRVSNASTSKPLYDTDRVEDILPSQHLQPLYNRSLNSNILSEFPVDLATWHLYT